MIPLPVDEIVGRYKAGESTYGLGHAYGVSNMTIRERLKTAGVKMRPASPMALVLPSGEIAARYKAGESTPDLAKVYGVDASTIQKRLRAAGVKVRSAGAQLGSRHASKPGGPLHADRNGYLQSITRDRKHCYVARACYEAYRGAIPAGHDIHHVNGNILDNAIENLACMPHEAHSQLPGRSTVDGI